jgi:3alpha(or 20beta)-hydroxysteroid dehydrogenase
MRRLDGKLAVITGSARGLGAAVAQLFHAQGATLVLLGADDRRGPAAAAELSGSRYYQCDVANEQHWQKVAAALAREQRPVDILVNNAAIVRYETILTCSVESVRAVLDVNLLGVMLGMRALAPLMKNGGSIVNVSSCAGLEGVNGAASYVASKWAVTGLTKAAALELGHSGIRVNSVHPHAIDTDMIGDEVRRAGGDELFRQQAIPRIATPLEVAQMVLFLASDDSSYCTGAAYAVDGGHLAGRIIPTLPGS